jgi:hypothetical protein
MDNWSEILTSIDTPIRLIGLCILALFVLALVFLKGAKGTHRTMMFGLLAVLLIGFASLLVLKSLGTPNSNPSTNGSSGNTPAGLTNGTTDPASDRLGCAIVVGLTIEDPFLNVRVNPNAGSTLKDRLRNGQKLDIFAQSGTWFNVAYVKSGVSGDGWVHNRWVQQVSC